jgi:four helix bundle protein
MINDLKLYKETYNLLLYLFPEIKKFPKSDKYTLGEQIKKTLISFLKNIVLFSKHKKCCLQEADSDLEIIRVYVRLCFDLKIITFNKYETISKKTNDIGNLLGGLIKQNK